MRNRFALKLFSLMVVLMALVVAGLLASPGGALASLAGLKSPDVTGTYTNPLTIVISGTGGPVQSFADPSIIKAADGNYYAYATGDPLNDNDRDTNGNLIFHKIPMIRSTDLVNWTYIGDVYTATPSWTAPSAGLFAPDIHFFNGQYYLYYAATDVQDNVSGEPNCGSDAAIGLARSPNPYGPWTDLGRPVVYPRRGGSGCNFFATIDPATTQDIIGNTYMYFGSYYGGIFGRVLSPDGTTSITNTETQVAIANRYEAPYIVKHTGYYYLFASATDCCRGPLTGYSVFAGRSLSPLGPFVDSRGVAMTETRVGGNVVISMNGNKWMGPGHNAVISDTASQDWFIYHAIDRGNAYFTDPNPFNVNKRPLLMDQLNWIPVNGDPNNAWPVVRSGYWASDTAQQAPATQPGATPQPTAAPKPQDMPGAPQPAYSDEFSGTLGSQWSWVRPPPTSTYSLSEHPGFFRFRTQRADLYQNSNDASVLIETAPTGDFLVETKLEFNAPPTGCCNNFQQGAIVLYQDDDHYLKLSHTSIWETRQTEWAKEVGVGDPDAARTATYGNTVIGSPGQPGVQTTTTYLRVVKRTDPATNQQLYTGYTSFDGVSWERGATWTHNLTNLKIGLVSMGRGGPASDPNIVLTSDFDYVRVFSLQPLVTETPTASPSTTGTTTGTATTTRTVTGTSTGTMTGTATGTTTGTASTTRTTTGTMTGTATGTTTGTVTGTVTGTASTTGTAQVTGTSTQTRTAVSTASMTTTGTVTGTVTGTASTTGTAQVTGTSTQTRTAVSTASMTTTGTAVSTASMTTTGTAVSTASGTASSVASASVTAQVTGTASATAQVTSTGTAQVSATATVPSGRVEVCHRTGSERNPYVRIQISGSALPAHLRHGDIYPVPASGCPGPGTATPVTSVTPEPTETSVACNIQFSDVPQGSTFYQFVRCLACNQVLGGYSDGTYRPGDNVSRGQLSKIVSNAAGFQDDVTGRQTFPDVRPGDPFYEYIERLALKGIIGGFPDGQFRPERSATRGQFSKIVANAGLFLEEVTTERFNDVHAGDPFYLYIERLASREILGGYSDGSFKPNALTSRGQAAKIVSNSFFANCNPPGQR